MNIKRTTILRSDLVQLYINKYHDETGIFLHFSSEEHDNQYKDVWKDVSEADKYDYMTMFIRDRESLEQKYLKDQNLNNIPIKKFDNAPAGIFLNRFNLKSYALYMNACYYKGMLRDIIGTTNNKDVDITLFCVQNIRTDRYIYASDNKADIQKYYDNTDYKVWEE